MECLRTTWLSKIIGPEYSILDHSAMFRILLTLTQFKHIEKKGK